MTFTANGKIKFSFSKTRRNLIYLSSFLVCYLNISNNFSKEWDKLKNFHAFVTRSCLLFAVNVMLNLSNKITFFFKNHYFLSGSAISVRLDIAVKDMSTLKTSPFYQLNRLSFIYRTLKSLLNDFGGFETCELTTNLLDTNDISVVYKPIRRDDEKTCEDVARKTVEYINSPTKNDVDPGQAVLAAAIFVDYSDTIIGPRAESFTSQVKKRRKKRHSHHSHESLFDNNARICPQTHLLLSLLVLVLLFSERIVDSWTHSSKMEIIHIYFYLTHKHYSDFFWPEVIHNNKNKLFTYSLYNFYKKLIILK